MSRRKSIELQVKNKRAERDSNRVLAKPTITILNRDSTCRNQRHAIAQPHAKSRALGNCRDFDGFLDISAHSAILRTLHPFFVIVRCLHVTSPDRAKLANVCP